MQFKINALQRKRQMHLFNLFYQMNMQMFYIQLLSNRFEWAYVSTYSKFLVINYTYFVFKGSSWLLLGKRCPTNDRRNF